MRDMGDVYPDERDPAGLDAPVEKSVDIVDGEAAARLGRQSLRMAGRPSLGSSGALGDGRSPRRQVRLPRGLNSALDEYAEDRNTTASEVIRLAVGEYLDHHRTSDEARLVSHREGR
jgi:hypothetical protein